MDSTEQPPAGWPIDLDRVRRAPVTDEAFRAAQPWTGNESFVVDDLTDRESEAFWAALGE